MELPDSVTFLKYDAELLVKGQYIAHWFQLDSGDESTVELGTIHCKPNKSGVKWVKFPDEVRPYSVDLNICDYLDLWCFVQDKAEHDGILDDVSSVAPSPTHSSVASPTH